VGAGRGGGARGGGGGGGGAAGVPNGDAPPGRRGTDGLVAQLGARQHVLSRGAARPALVVMVGTAVTVDAVDAEGRFLGGLILPGHGIMLRALESGTAGLRVPKIGRASRRERGSASDHPASLHTTSRFSRHRYTEDCEQG